MTEDAKSRQTAAVEMATTGLLMRLTELARWHPHNSLVDLDTAWEAMDHYLGVIAKVKEQRNG